MKNVKLKDYTLKDLINNILNAGQRESTYENGYNIMQDMLSNVLGEIDGR